MVLPLTKAEVGKSRSVRGFRGGRPRSEIGVGSRFDVRHRGPACQPAEAHPAPAKTMPRMGRVVADNILIGAGAHRLLAPTVRRPPPPKVTSRRRPPTLLRDAETWPSQERMHVAYGTRLTMLAVGRARRTARVAPAPLDAIEDDADAPTGSRATQAAQRQWALLREHVAAFTESKAQAKKEQDLQRRGRETLEQAQLRRRQEEQRARREHELAERQQRLRAKRKAKRRTELVSGRTPLHVLPAPPPPTERPLMRAALRSMPTAGARRPRR